jgi:hypothetical protein
MFAPVIYLWSLRALLLFGTAPFHAKVTRVSMETKSNPGTITSSHNIAPVEISN